MTERGKRAIKSQQLKDDTLSLNDLVKYAQTELNLCVSRSTISRILREFNMKSFIAPKKPKLNAQQKRLRVS